jgi:hypothetical protein
MRRTGHRRYFFMVIFVALAASLLFCLDSSAQSPTQPAGTVLAAADGETPGINVEVTELKKMGNDTLSLKFVMINDSDKKVGFGYDFGDRDHQNKDFNSIGGIHLVDSDGKKKYLVVRDSEQNCVCSRNMHDLPPKSRMNLWARFPAPPDSIQKISIIIPHFQPLDDVPIGR